MSSTTSNSHAPSRESSPGATSTVVADMSMSLDGFVADLNDGVDRVFAWYGKPQPPRQPGSPDRDHSVVGAIISGRRTFEIAKGWGGKHPTGAPVIVVTHRVPDGWPRPESNVFFNTEGIESAIEQATAIADGKIIALATPKIIQQCLNLGLVDRIQVSVVPLLLGSGIRMFENLTSAPLEFDTSSVRDGNGVTHLTYQVR